MKKIIAFGLLVLLAGCGAKPVGFSPTQIVLANDCPERATCSIQLLAGKSMVVKSAENRMTYKLEDHPDKSVIVYKFKRTAKGNIQDANYNEEIVFELDKNVTVTHLKNEQLQNTKMIFSRFCFCDKAQIGLFAVKQGMLTIDAQQNGLLNFTIPDVPQVTQQIRFSLK